MNKKLLGIAVLIIVLIGGGFLWNRNRDTDTTDTNAVASLNETISYQGVDGQTALALLKSTYTVETKSYSFGEMVIAINGKSATDGVNFWEFLVNGQQATTGAGDYATTAGETITWKLSEINAQ
jgi:hypothetical protein